MNKHELIILCDILRLARDSIYEFMGRGNLENIKDIQTIKTMRAINRTIIEIDSILEDNKK